MTMRNLIPKLARVTNACICSLIAAAFLLAACTTNHCTFEPEICYFPNEHLINTLPTSFAPITPEELSTEWGKELFIAQQFAKEWDLYQALTSFKRALFLIPEHLTSRRDQIEFCILESYYFGRKYNEVLLSFQNSHLQQISLQFPAITELLLIIYESYIETDQLEHALKILCILDVKQPTISEKLTLNHAITDADCEVLNCLAESDADVHSFLATYSASTKSVRKAELLNAFLPGAGYYYVGQKSAALTSFIINALFITAAYQFFERGYIAAGAITASIEAGWYFGGINGAGLAAKEYNEHVYEAQAKDFLVRQKLFPILMFNFAF